MTPSWWWKRSSVAHRERHEPPRRGAQGDGRSEWRIGRPSQARAGRGFGPHGIHDWISGQFFRQFAATDRDLDGDIRVQFTHSFPALATLLFDRAEQGRIGFNDDRRPSRFVLSWFQQSLCLELDAMEESPSGGLTRLAVIV